MTRSDRDYLRRVFRNIRQGGYDRALFGGSPADDGFDAAFDQALADLVARGWPAGVSTGLAKRAWAGHKAARDMKRHTKGGLPLTACPIRARAIVAN